MKTIFVFNLYKFLPKSYTQARKYKVKLYMVIKSFVIVINTINIFS
jgi:hypothetical protein